MKNLALLRYKDFFRIHQSKAIFGAVLGLTAIASTLIALNLSKVDTASKGQEDKNTTLVVARLNTLQTLISGLQEVVNKPTPKTDLTTIADQINQLTRRIEKLKSVDSESLNQTLTQTMNHTESTLSSQLDSIKEVVSHLGLAKAPLKYLKAESLPFKIVSVDSIQQVPVASISYDFKTVPLEKGDSLAGWKIVRLDYSKQHVELENANKERVLLTHEHIG
ncbi:MAG: hypothetical protein H0U57_06040 [Tatlockia sp.]|nr:hypothetical protein [Tatlockia sp.]